MHIFKKFFLACLIFLLLLVFTETGFTQEQVVKTQYFTVYFDKECNLTEITKKLNTNYFLHIETLSQSYDYQDMNSIVSRLFDSIYLEVSDILDIHIYNFHGTIKVLSDKSKLSEILQTHLGKKIDSPSFYFQSKNTIYISSSDLTLGMLAHEIAHAIISHYFVVAPPPKVQEVLSGYVEYSIMKATGNPTQIKK